MGMDDILGRLREKKRLAEAGGGKAGADRQRARGKWTARERVRYLLDPGTFVEMHALMSHRAVHFGLDRKVIPGDGVVTGYGAVDGRLVYLFAQDFTVLGGSLGEAHAAKICHVMDQALRNGAPIVGLNDSGGARIQEGVDALKGYGDIFYRNTQASGVVPQVSAIMGPSAGGAVYSPALGDFVLMTRGTSYMFITGPQVVKAVLSQDVRAEDLGGADVHGNRTGIAHLVGENDAETLKLIRELLGYLPANNREDPPCRETTDDPLRETPELYSIIPERSRSAYDVVDVITTLVDDAAFLQLQAGFAPNMVIGFARLDGRPVGVVANNPRHLAGVLDIDASDKAARFIRFCDAFNIPVLTCVDTPGYMPGVQQEHAGIIRHGAKLLYAYSEATVPLLTVIMRKAYGGAYIAMASRHLRTDVVLALPTAEIAVMGPEGACQIIFKDQIAKADDPAAETKKLVEDYREMSANPYLAASRGYVDDVVDPKHLRTALVNALRACRSKKVDRPSKKHGNMPV